jgi:acylglycerol lipase
MKKLDKNFSENRWMMNPKSFYFTSKDGLSLFGRAWLSASSNPKGIVHLIHGLGEHSGRYDPIGKALMKAGYHLISFDLRGHGLSAGRRGDAPGIEFLLSDIQVFLQKSKALIGSILPRFLYGHSHGGVMVINFSLDYDYELNGVIVSSPVFCSTSPTSKIRTNFISLLSKIWPGFLIKKSVDSRCPLKKFSDRQSVSR